MEQIRIASGLKFFTATAFALATLFFFWYVPLVVGKLAMNPENAWLKWPAMCGMWLIGLLCYLALALFWGICSRIGKDNSFCRENARAMKRIGLLAFGAGGLILGGCVFLGCAGSLRVLMCVLSLFVIFGACGVGVVCFALSALIRNAAKLKEENDLTI